MIDVEVLRMATIPKEIAQQMCVEIREENRGKWYTFNGLWCWGCTAQARGDVRKMCFRNTPENRGCTQVNQRFDLRFTPHEVQDS